MARPALRRTMWVEWWATTLRHDTNRWYSGQQLESRPQGHKLREAAAIKLEQLADPVEVRPTRCGLSVPGPSRLSGRTGAVRGQGPGRRAANAARLHYAVARDIVFRVSSGSRFRLRPDYGRLLCTKMWSREATFFAPRTAEADIFAWPPAAAFRPRIPAVLSRRPSAPVVASS